MKIALRAVSLVGRRRSARPLLSALSALLSVLCLVTGTANAGTASPGAPLALPSPAYLTSIACVDADTCYVIGRASTDAGPGVLITLTDGTVSQEQTISADGASFMQALACVPDGACYAIGSTSLGSGVALLLTINDGVPGAIQTVDGVGFWESLACNESGTCYAVGGSSGPGGHGVVVPIAGGQAGKAEPVPGTLIMWDLDCPTADACYGIGSADLGAATLLVPLVDGQPGAILTMQGGGFRAIACPAPASCYAVGYAGGPASTNESQGTGGFIAISGGQPGPLQTVDAVGPFISIACPTSSTCFAFANMHGPPRGAAAGPLPGAVVPISNGLAGSLITVSAGAGNQAGAAPADALGSADCPNSSMCYVLTTHAIVPVAAGGG